MAYEKIDINNLGAWIKANPGKKFKIGGKEYTAPKSGLEQFAEKLTSPIRAIPAGLFAAISGKSGEDNPFLTKQEEGSFYQDPGKFALKSAAGLASFGIPGGAAASATTRLGAIGSAAGRGALAGGLGGYGMSEQGQELQGALGGAVTGGALGGLLGGLGFKTTGKGAQTQPQAPGEYTPVNRPAYLKQGTTKITQEELPRWSSFTQTPEEQIAKFNGLDPIKKANIEQSWRNWGVAKLDETFEESIAKNGNFMNYMDAKGLLPKETTASAFSKAATKARKLITEDKLKLLTGSTPSTVFDVLEEKALNNVRANYPALKENGKAIKTIKGVFKRLRGEGASVTDVAIDSEIKKLGKNVFSSQKANLNDSENAYKYIWGELKDILNEVPGYNEIEGISSASANFSKNIGKTLQQQQRGMSVFSPATAQGQLLQIQKSGEKVAKLRGGVLDFLTGSKGYRTLANAPDTVKPSVVKSILPQLLQQLTSGKVAQQLPKVAGIGVGMSAGATPIPQEISQPTSKQSVTPNMQELGPLQYLAMAKKIAPDATLAQSLALAKFLMPVASVTAKKTDLQKKAGTALSSIDKLDAILQADPSVKWKQYLPWQVGDPEAQMFKTAGNDITDSLARMRTGAVINDQEFKLYNSYIPKITDTPQNVQFKLQQLKSIFGGIYSGEGVADTSSLQQLLGQ